MQSEKTGQTYIEHNGHTYQQNSNINIGKDLQENVQTGEVREESKVDKTAEETNNHKG